MTSKDGDEASSQATESPGEATAREEADGSAGDTRPLAGDPNLLEYARGVAEALRNGGDDSPLQPKVPGYQRGAAGFASFLWQAGRAFQEPAYFVTAERFLEKGARIAEAHGYTNDGTERIDIAGYENSVFIGPSGLDWVAAHIAHERGDLAARREALLRIVARARADLPGGFGVGLTCGLAGHLELAAVGLETFPDLSGDEQAELTAMGQMALENLLPRLEKPPASRNGLPDQLAMAHGWAGPTWAALRWAPDDERLVTVLQRIASLRIVDDDEVSRWPVAGRPEVQVSMGDSWCNGVAGIAKLFARAYLRGHTDSWIREALEGSLLSLAAPEMSMIGGLCCGAAGFGVGLADIGAALGVEALTTPIVREHLLRAFELIEDPESPSSEFLVGKVGVAAAALSLAAPQVDRPLGFAL